MWRAARDPEIERDLKDTLVAKAAALGFDISRLTFVDQH